MTFRLVEIVLGGAGVSAAMAVVIVLSQNWHGKHTLDHDLDGVQKVHTSAVPRIGGLAIFAAIALIVLLCEIFKTDSLIPSADVKVAMLLLLAGMPTFVAGMVEDLTKKVSVRVRLAASIASALAASWLVGATVDQLNLWGVDGLLAWAPFALLVTAVVVAGGVNAVNIIDGFNGLAGSTVVVMLAAFAAVAWQVQDVLVVELALLGIGAAVGFLCVNYPSGRIFLGDGGAYFLGFWVAEVGVLLLVRNASVNAWQILSICAYPVIEVLYSIYRRKIVRQASPGAADGLHLHTLVYRRVVTRLFALSGQRPWKRNAAVAFLMMPWIATAALLSVIAGRTMLGSMMVVLAQVVVYIAVYGRIVRGRWWARRNEVLSVREGEAEAR